MIPQVAYRLPQVRLRRGAEDLGRGALRLGVRRAEQHPPTPDPVFRPAYLEANGDELSVESDGGKVVDDCFVRIGCVVACRLSGHADPRAGLGKDKCRSRLRNTAEPAAPEAREVGGGCPRRPRDNSSTSPPQMYHPTHNVPSATTNSQKPRAARWCHRGSRA